MKLMNTTLSTLLILAVATAKTTASPIAKIASGETVKITQVADITTSEANMKAVPFLHGKFSDIVFIQNNTSWITPIGIRALQISTVLYLNKNFKITSNNGNKSRSTIYIRKDTNDYTYCLDPEDQTATRSNGNIIHEVDELSHSKPDSYNSIMIAVISSIMQPYTININSYLKYFQIVGNSKILNYKCKLMTSKILTKQDESLKLWVAHINGKNVLLRVDMIDNGTPFVLLDTLAIQTVNPPKDFLNLPAGYTIKASNE